MAEYGVGYHLDDSGVAVMHRYIFIAAVLIVRLASAPSVAVTAKENRATCKVGAAHQKVAGAARGKFMKNCRANKNDPPGGAGAAGAAGGGPRPPKN